MANVLFTKYKENLLGTGTRVDWDTDTMKAVLIDAADVTINVATHDFYDDISAGAVGTPTALGSITQTSGTLDAADTTFTAVAGDPVENLVIYKDTGTPGTSTLCVFFDTATGLTGSLTPNGGNVVVTWNGSGIFSL